MSSWRAVQRRIAALMDIAGDEDATGGAEGEGRATMQSSDQGGNGDGRGVDDGTGAPVLIAVVEDHTATVSTYRGLFEDRGWRILHCATGEEALRNIPPAHPDLILLDLGLPGVDGKDLYRILQAHRDTQHTPILVVTASEEWKVQRDELAPYRLLRKPCEAATLMAAVEELLAMSRAHVGGPRSS